MLQYILEYQSEQDARRAKTLSFETTLVGHPQYRVIAVNAGPTNSKIFDTVWDEDKYDIMMPFFWYPKVNAFKVSLYTVKTDTVNCGAIAKSYGGGGHVGAAGFQCTELPFELKGKKNE